MRADTLHALLLMGILVGLAFSAYAGYETTHPSAQGLCQVNSYVSCGKIASSGHTTTLGIEDWLWGVAGFVLLLALDVPLYRTWKRKWLVPVFLLSLVGVLLAAYFAYVELVVIQGLCLVCLGSYFSGVVVFGAAAALLRLGSTKGPRPAATPGPVG